MPAVYVAGHEGWIPLTRVEALDHFAAVPGGPATPMDEEMDMTDPKLADLLKANGYTEEDLDEKEVMPRR